MARTNARKQISPIDQAPAPAAKSGIVVSLFTEPHPNAGLLKRQYEAQRAMLAENLAKQQPVDASLLNVQYQRATRTPAQETTIREQAQMQGQRGAAFKL